MKLHMTSRHHVEKTPLATFAGDESIPVQTYEQLMTDGYTSISQYLKAGARAVDLSIDPVTEERWRRLVVAWYYIDDFIDNLGDSAKAHELYKAGMATALAGGDIYETVAELGPHKPSNPLLVPSVVSLRNSLTDIEPSNLEALQVAASVINDAALEKASTSDIDKYISILTDESIATADLIDLTADSDTTRQPGYPTFYAAIRRAMLVSVYLDSALDLKDDYEQGVTKVTPTVRHIGRLALSAVRPARESAKWGDDLSIAWGMVREIRPYVATSNQ